MGLFIVKRLTSCDFRLTNMNHLHYNFCIYVSSYAENMLTLVHLLIRNEDVIEMIIKN